ncbi:hypothetical protein G7Y89_g3665 [Cudoniella acicularis]|uniref:Uncharacterized protein n=1 Tax=Cudoniella acicularis TaxID=354080 RepID=A0A8H4RQX6_9HELO|nr:hypothetical protein G7Y89_g3665 [Cudoniella acicularis]
MLRAIVEHKNQVRKGITAENADVVFATSSIIAFHVQSGHHVSAVEEEHNALTHWFQSWDGVRTILRACWDHLMANEIKELILSETAMEYLGFIKEEPEEAKKSQPFNFLLEDLDTTSVDTETVLAYSTSVDALNRIFREVGGMHVMKFTAIVCKRFVNLVGERDPRAFTIVGYFLMLLKKLDRVWWLQGAAERDFRFVMKSLSEEWKSRMAWAASEIEGGTTLDERAISC